MKVTVVYDIPTKDVPYVHRVGIVDGDTNGVREYLMGMDGEVGVTYDANDVSLLEMGDDE